MFERFRKETPALQLYGKLPLAKDYLRVGASKGTARTFRDWLDGAFSTRAVRGGAPSFPWPARFVIGVVEDEPLMGCAWPSSDQGGERPFPFALFLERRRKALLAGFHDSMEVLVEAWTRLDGCYAARANFADGESFLAGMRGLEIEISGSDPAGSQRIEWESWTSALWPGEGHDGLLQTLSSLSHLGREGHRGPLRLPLVGDLPVVPQVNAWWTALVALQLFTTDSVPTVFFPQGEVATEEPAFAVFFRRALRMDDAIWINSARGQSNQGQGDYCIGGPHLAGECEPVSESVPGLSESMRGALASARARR